ncbi:hypothetical protein [Duganella dendranthematis]|nr:hypothetical protein [Duganella dendranthematis]
MNAIISAASNHPVISMENDERWQAVQQVLSSPAFVKAPRMRAMLAFLMHRKLSGMEVTINEYALGIEVFHRDARDYDTATDPVVRVQMGRLRERLAQYYAADSHCGGLQIVIPPGTYIPQLTPRAAPPPQSKLRLRLAPLRMLNPDSEGATAFVSGLEEELALQLFQRCGGGPELAPQQAQWLEVSVRVEPRHARASIRLLSAAGGDVVFLQRCDCHGELGISLQEELAVAIFTVLQQFSE